MRPRGALGVLVLLLCGWTACHDARDPTSASGLDVLLVGGDVFADGDRAARRLEDMARRTGVLGDSAVRLVHVPGAGPRELARALDAEGVARAAIVVLGDLRLMTGVDPSRVFPVDQTSVSSRVIDWEAFDDGLDALQAAADRIGARLVTASPPLGIQGRIELPELLAVNGRLRRRGPTLDLTGWFRALEPGPLFVDGMTVLDEYGHDALAEALLRTLVDGLLPLPPESGLESRARQTWAELLAWASGDDDALGRADAAGLLAPSADGRLAVAAAAMLTALHGVDGPARGQWRQLDDVPGSPPGLILGRALAGEALRDVDGFETELAQVLADAFALDARKRADAVERAAALTDRFPQRTEAWLTLRIAGLLGRRDPGARRQSRGRIEAFDTRPVSPGRRERLLEAVPGSLRALPALLVACSPWEGALVTGPDLQGARRKARTGQPGAALKLLDLALRRGPCPPRWSEERALIAADAGR